MVPMWVLILGAPGVLVVGAVLGVLGGSLLAKPFWARTLRRELSS